ncbi:hypothetical protein DB42_AQ00050 [Neochlamydia sp. EPS4]|nr:hypothetical protein DB42_AQ00050 [Neochlamydia sp. EPS4]
MEAASRRLFFTEKIIFAGVRATLPHVKIPALPGKRLIRESRFLENLCFSFFSKYFHYQMHKLPPTEAP